MHAARHLILCALVVALIAPAVHAEPQGRERPRLKINYSVPVDQRKLWGSPSAAPSAAMHPSAKGALIGAGIGAGFWGGVGLVYCTIGPNEVGECSNADMWTRGFLLWGAAGAGIGALIGALR